MKLIITVPPYARFDDIVEEPVVEGVRLNTTHAVQMPLDELLASVAERAAPKQVWIDLKGRQLRIVNYAVSILRDKEMHTIEVSHPVHVHLPATLTIDDGNYTAEVMEILDGNKLVVPSSTERGKGLPLPGNGDIGIRPGMSITITDPSLRINGYLTAKDKQYIEAAKKNGLHTYMASYVEEETDITDIIALDPDAVIVAKIESKKGFDFVKHIFPKYKGTVQLMAARGDMYMEVDQPDHAIDGCELLISHDDNAILASRIFESLVDVEKMPRSQDLFDVYAGMLMGYKRFMLGDDVCTKQDSVQAAIGLFTVLAEKFEQYHAKKGLFSFLGGKT